MDASTTLMSPPAPELRKGDAAARAAGAAPDYTRLDLPFISPGVARALNQIHTVRPPGVAPVETLILSVAIEDRSAPPPIQAPALRLAVRIAGQEAHLTLPRAVAERIVSCFEPGAAQGSEISTLLLLTELAAAASLDALEERLGVPIVLSGLASSGAALPGTHQVRLRGDLAGTAFGATLSLGPGGLTAVARLVEGRPSVRFKGHGLKAWASLRRGVTRLSQRQLARAAPGDVLLLDDDLFARGLAAFVVDDAYAALSRYGEGTARLLSPLRPIRFLQDTPTMKQPGAQSEASDLGELPVTVAFELGRQQVALAELEAMGPGSIFTLGSDPKAMVAILANGQRIGQGEIVKIGERVGVLAVRLFDRE